jgi:hypothetical protein
MAKITLNNGHFYTVDYLTQTQIGKKCKLEDVKLIVEDMSQENVSNAKVEGDNKITALGNLKLLSFNVDKEAVDYRITLFFKEVPQSEIDLAKEKAKSEALRLCAVAGLNVLSPKFVIQWCEFLDPWNEYKFPYKKGERFKHNNKPYEVKEDVISNKNEPPEKALRYYKEVTVEDTYKDYDKNKIYNIGDIVRHNGKLWISKWADNKNHEPSISSAWKEFDGK